MFEFLGRAAEVVGGDGAKTYANNIASVDPESTQGTKLKEQYSRIGGELANDKDTLSFSSIFKSPEELQAAQQGIASGVGDRLQNTLGGIFANQKSAEEELGTWDKIKSGTSLVMGSSQLPDSTVRQQVKKGIQDGARKALGATEGPQGIRQAFSNIAAGKDAPVADSAGTPAEQMAAPIANKIRSSVTSAVKSNQSMPALPSMISGVQDFFGSMFKQSSDMPKQVGEAVAESFTPQCPAVQDFADNVTKQIVAPGYNSGVEQHGNFAFKAFNSLAQGDFGAALDTLFSGFGAGGAPSKE